LLGHQGSPLQNPSFGLRSLRSHAGEPSFPFAKPLLWKREKTKMAMKKEFYIIISLSLLFFILNYSFLDSLTVNYLTDSDSVSVERIIDGDTIVAGNQTVRLLGINTPERGERYYSEAKEFLENEISNKTIQLIFGKDKKDRYGRTLAYVFFNGENINLKLVENGFASYYFPSGKDVYYNDFKKTWMNCIEENNNLCEKSSDKCSSCIVLKELNAKTQEAIFYNQCNFSCDLTDWEVKDEGRKKFVFSEFFLESENEIVLKVVKEKTSGNFLAWERKDYVWTKTGDTLFLRDKNGGLILWETY
jgi:micrococcal nuclease